MIGTVDLVGYVRWRWQASPALRWATGVALALLVGAVVGAFIVLATTLFNKPKLLLMLVAAPVGAYLLLRWPEIVILLLIGITNGLVDSSYLPVIELGPMSLHMPDIILTALLALVFLRATTRRDFKLYGSAISLPLALFFGAVVISMLNGILVFGVGPNPAIRVARNLYQWLIFFPVIFLVRDEQALRRLITGLWVLSVFMSIGVAAPQLFKPLHLLPVNDVALDTAGQTYTDVTRLFFIGERLLYMMIPATVGVLATRKQGRQIPLLIVLGGAVFWLFRSYQRNYWGTAALGILLLLVLISGPERLRLFKRMLPIMIIGLIGVGVLFAVQPGEVGRQISIAVERIGSLTEDLGRTDSSIQWRLIENFYAMKSIQTHPLLGIGIANIYRPEMLIEIESNQFDMGWYAHNAYLWITLTMGLVGLVTFLGVCATFLVRILAYRRDIQDDTLRGLALGFGVGFIGMMISNLVAPNFTQNWALAIYPASMGICEVALRLAREQQKEQTA